MQYIHSDVSDKVIDKIKEKRKIEKHLNKYRIERRKTSKRRIKIETHF